MKTKKCKGQSTVEYLVMMAAVIGILLLTLGPGGLFRSRLRTTIDTSSQGMVTMTQRAIDSMN
jgi:hypothetical protein